MGSDPLMPWVFTYFIELFTAVGLEITGCAELVADVDVKYAVVHHIGCCMAAVTGV